MAELKHKHEHKNLMSDIANSLPKCTQMHLGIMICLN